MFGLFKKQPRKPRTYGINIGDYVVARIYSEAIVKNNNETIVYANKMLRGEIEDLTDVALKVNNKWYVVSMYKHNGDMGNVIIDTIIPKK